MRRMLAFAAALAAVRAFAGPIGAGDPHAVSATGFPGAFLETIALASTADARYGTLLLDAFDMHLQAVGVMTGPVEVGVYLEQSAGGSEGVRSLRAALGRRPLEPTKAAALLLAEALARPDQFRELLDGLESRHHGLGRHAGELLRRARGAGDKTLIASLREAGTPPKTPPVPEARENLGPYLREGRLTRLFDLPSSEGRDGIRLEEPAADAPAPVARPRGADVSLPARP
ncbi:MAG: hypothetical protein ACHQ49_12920 [Elusimicrobiota bacterium]